MTPNEIIDRLNELLAEQEDIGGETFIELVQDTREENGLPPLEGEELAAAEARCDANADRYNTIDQEMDDLRNAYEDLTGYRPHYRDFPAQYQHNWYARTW